MLENKTLINYIHFNVIIEINIHFYQNFVRIFDDNLTLINQINYIKNLFIYFHHYYFFDKNLFFLIIILRREHRAYQSN